MVEVCVECLETPRCGSLAEICALSQTHNKCIMQEQVEQIVLTSRRSILAADSTETEVC